MKLARRVVAIVAAVAAVGSLGCGEGRKQTTSAPTVTGDVPLPVWTPKDPSPEFLRAARVLRPMPMEDLIGGTAGDQARQARRAGTLLWLPALYEFFGTLTDEQMERFLSAKEIHIPVKLLSAQQRAALDKWFQTWRRVNKGQYPLELKHLEDYLVMLYKFGAREDLSNVEVGFVVQGGHAACIDFRVSREDGTVGGCCTNFACI